MDPTTTVLLSMLEKDDQGVPTKRSLYDLMVKIDKGVASEGWSPEMRRELQGRIVDAAKARYTRIQVDD